MAWSDSGALLGVTDPLGDTVRYDRRGPFNQPTRRVDARDNTLHFAYDSVGNLRTLTYPDGTDSHYVYDGIGSIMSTVNRRDQTTTYAFNALGQVIMKTYADGRELTYTYDAKDRLDTITDLRGTTQLTYDTANRLARIDYPDGRWIAYQYDAVGRRTRLEDHSGFVVQYRYDTVGRLSELADGADATLVAYTYDAAGRVIREDKANGTYSITEYDGAKPDRVDRPPWGRRQHQQSARLHLRRRRAADVAHHARWQLDLWLRRQRAAHRRRLHVNQSKHRQSGSRIPLRRDGKSRDDLVNGVTTGYAAGSFNQYTAIGPATLRYDADGNLVEEIGPSGAKSYAYDSAGRLIEVTTGEGTWQYEYDVFGNRIAVIADGVRTEFLVDPTGIGNVIGSYDAAGNRTASYAHGDGLELMVTAGTPAFFDFDAIGSTVGLSEASGVYANQYAYLPFGESLLSTETIDNPFEFIAADGVMQDDNGLHFMRARYYSAVQGRFVAEDPLLVIGGEASTYRYAFNDPLRTRTRKDYSPLARPFLRRGATGGPIRPWKQPPDPEGWHRRPSIPRTQVTGGILDWYDPSY